MWLERRETWTQQSEDAREAGDIDYGRVIHSASFRRLQGKTQILSLGDSDFYRTRLTHSLEVAQIAGNLARQLARSFPAHAATPHLPERSLIQAIGCTHDLGHPPFGHGGEVALNYCMRGDGGFEGNGHTLRILARLENFSATAGANLTRRTLLGVLKYPVSYEAARNPEIVPKLLDGSAAPTTIEILDDRASKPPKCFLNSEKDVVDWILAPLNADQRVVFQEAVEQPHKHKSPLHKSLDCSIMDLADDIAYGVHDLEDAIALGLVTKASFAGAASERCPTFLDALKAKYPEQFGNDVFGQVVDALFGSSKDRKHYVSRLVNHFVTAVEFTEDGRFAEPLLRYRARMQPRQRAFLDVLKSFVHDQVIKSPGVQHLEFKGQAMVIAVFEAMRSAPRRLLPRDACERFEAAHGDLRVICDYVAGMTDAHLLRIYERLFSPRMGSVFDKL